MSPTEREHILDGTCWCNPTTIHVPGKAPMTDMTWDDHPLFEKKVTNEAAERLRQHMNRATIASAAYGDLDAALAAERRATVERIRARLEPTDFDALVDLVQLDALSAILDEEAAR